MRPNSGNQTSQALRSSKRRRCVYCGCKTSGATIAGRPSACSSHADLLRLEDRLYRGRPGEAPREAPREAVQATRERRR